MLLLFVRFCLKSFQLSSLWFLKNLNFFFLYVSINSIFLVQKTNFFEFSEFFFSKWKNWFSDDNHLTKSESDSMMVRFDTYDWTDSRIGWVRYESLITCRWISCSYLYLILRNRWRFYTVYLKKMNFKSDGNSVDLQFITKVRSYVLRVGRYFCVFLIRTELFSLFLDSHQTIDCIELCWNWLSRHKCRTRLKSWSDWGST